ncbi:MAG: MBL fold metallo-hydrolase [Nitrososphaerota archaeon]|nr:MBL fold metallo-hydrolase [Nitrososphaerota archaeon]MDG7048538.1 MBL fold metallo-hydrolase [Nitrososphaerota archaeon]MDG7051069.1 MBL fold metallo-hydrolase [Nitrososphaerota archaeon]
MAPRYDISQLAVGDMGNFTYLISSAEEALVIDASFGGKEVLKMLAERGLKLRYILSTHNHFDHNVDNAYIRRETGAEVVAHKMSPIEKDISIEDGDKVKVGSMTIVALHTPGHTPDSVCYRLEGNVFTGDTLFVGTCGRVDLPGGNAGELFQSMRRLCNLEKSTVVFPGHDYGVTKASTIGRECTSNPAMTAHDISEFLAYIKS